MTANTLQYQRNKEEQRANQEKERENRRSNKTREKETERSNRAGEELERRGQNMKLAGDVTKGAMGIFAKAIPTPNHISWYNKDKKLLEDVARLPFGRPVVANVDLPIEDELAASPVLNPTVILKFRTLPTIGIDPNTNGNAVNLAARNLYAFVRHANSGHSNYEPQDLMMYLLSMDSVYSFIAYISRVYTAALSVNSQNYALPEALVTAMGVQYSDITSNLADFRAFINRMVLSASTFNVPREFTYFDRHIWLFGNVFADYDIRKCGLFVFTPAYLFEQNDATGNLDPVAIDAAESDNSKTLLTFAQLKALGQRLIDGLLKSEFMGIISGDILKAYGEGGLFKLSQMPDAPELVPVYDKNVLSQIAGMSIVGNPTATTDVLTIADAIGIKQSVAGQVIYQGPDWARMPVLRAQATTANSKRYSITGAILNGYSNDVTSDEVMIMTRLAATTAWSTFTGNAPENYRYNHVRSAGSEVVLTATICKLVNDSSAGFVAMESVLTLNIAGDWSKLVAIAQTDWHPVVYVAPPTGTLTNMVPLTDLVNWYVVQEQTLRALHDVAILSEFSVPMIGNVNR